MNGILRLRAGRRDGPPVVHVDDDLLGEIAGALDLRAPNELAVATIIHRLAEYAADGGGSGFEGVVDAATGVGKTFILAATIDYLTFSAEVRNFAVVTPGRTILDKTVANFTPGGRKSLTAAMSTRSVVVTAENFATPAMRAAMDDPELVKLYVFTVQALIAPTSKVARRTRKFQEGLGKAFYEHLAGLADLVVFADEHHTYYGRQFSQAVRGLHPFALLGLTATPHPDTPDEQIIFRYPLANAIADRIVKTPVLVGRMDDRNDAETKLRDGVALLDAKLDAVVRYCATGPPAVNPVMLVVCESIEQAKDVEELLASNAFYGGRYRGAVLRIDSETPDASLAALETVEDPNSPVRVIVSVQMLKEGWDVANVYVIASLRPSISEILTEQTLGRGLRLPWGHYTDVELLDTLEVLAHERYEDLLVRAKALKEELVDWRTVARPDHPQFPMPVRPQGQLPLVAVVTGDGPQSTAGVDPASPTGKAEPAALTLVPTETRVHHLRQAAAQVAQLRPRHECGELALPVLEMEPTTSTFSLADVTDVEPFRTLGRQLRLHPEDVLRRSLLSARTVVGRDGITRVELDTRPASDTVHSQGVLLPPAQARAELVRLLTLAPQVPTRAAELRAAEPLVDAFLDGLGDAVDNLGAWLDRAAGGLIDLVARAARRKAQHPVMRELLRLESFAPVRTGRAEQSSDRLGEFRRNLGYRGWAKAMHEEVWFDSRPERSFANVVDTSELVRCWARLLRGDLPILWNGMRSWYHPDFIVVEHPADSEAAGVHWLVEIKADRELSTFDVDAKREAAERWAAHVSADPATGAVWRYLLLGESAVSEAKGDWRALRSRYSGR